MTTFMDCDECGLRIEITARGCPYCDLRMRLATAERERDEWIKRFGEARESLKNASRMASKTDAIVTAALHWARTHRDDTLLHREETELLEVCEDFQRREEKP
jgi:hypothetical protein